MAGQWYRISWKKGQKKTSVHKFYTQGWIPAPGSQLCDLTGLIFAIWGEMRGKRMPYYAHIRQDENGETIYQTVAEHLTGTAALCREFAADFGAEADGDLMGLAHDLGKCTDAFQKRLLEGGPVVDHTTAGMLTCIKMKRPSAAACVAGHHGGLLDVGNLRTARAGEATLSGRFKKGVE